MEVESGGGCHGNRCRYDVKEEGEALDTRCRGTVEEVGGSCLQSVGAAEVGCGDEQAMAETVRDSATSVGAGGTVEAHGGDDGGAASMAAVDDEGAVASASWMTVTTLCESQDHCQYLHRRASYRHRCCQRHLSVCACARYVETVPAAERASPCLAHWHCNGYL